ncbi:MAG: phosphoribosyltransferase family protein [Candidatus Eremiobacterota bacterium]
MILEPLLEFLYPPRCPGCHRVIRGFCAACRGRILPVCTITLPALDGVDSAGVYEGPLRNAILDYKLRGRTRHADFLATLMARAAGSPGAGWWVTEVPSPWLRGHRRGFNPAALLARRVAALLGLPHRTLLTCRGNPPQQKGRDLPGRNLLPPDRFRARSAAPHQVLLVDDVVTTGSTLQACARALRSAGAVQVRALTAARQV